LTIRHRITELMPEGQPAIGGALDFYYSPLVEAWDPSQDDRPDDAGGISHLGAHAVAEITRQPAVNVNAACSLEQKSQVVLYGPPGTGKTYEAKDLARRLIRHQALIRWNAADFLRHRDLIEQIADRQVRRLQLHQGYSYEDFIWGMRIGAGGATVPQEGYLLKLIEEIDDYRYRMSVRQIELSDTRVFDRPQAGRAWFEQTIRDQLDLGRPDQVQIVFDRTITKRTPGRFQTKVITKGVEPIIQAHYKHSKVKQYLKHGRALRTETTVNDPYDFGILRTLSAQTWQQLRQIGNGINDRLLQSQLQACQCAPDPTALQRSQ
jgi:hypothetical protein